MGDEVIRANAGRNPVPELGGTPFVHPPALADARVAIVTTAALYGPGQSPLLGGDQSFRILESGARLTLGHSSPNFDRSGWLVDTNVILPVDRLQELADQGWIGSVAPRQLSFMGAQPDHTMTTIQLDTGPAAAELLRQDGVDVALITPV